MELIPLIEQLSLNAWPGIRTVLNDGWLLRISDGITRRANAIYPLWSTALGLEDKIAYCENLYQRHGLKPIFKITQASEPIGLDSVLATRGYAFDAETSVQTLVLTHSVALPQDFIVEVTDKLQSEWLFKFMEYNGLALNNKDAYHRIMEQIVPARAFVSVLKDDEIVACGLAVAEMGFVGLFDIVVAPAERGNGYGKIIVNALLNWGFAKGCNMAYLQVMLNNPVALNLYGAMGFEEQYRYWYRIKA